MEYTVEQIKTPDFIIRVHRPIISEEERNRRMKAIHKASEKLLMEAERKKQ